MIKFASLLGIGLCSSFAESQSLPQIVSGTPDNPRVYANLTITGGGKLSNVHDVIFAQADISQKPIIIGSKCRRVVFDQPIFHDSTHWLVDIEAGDLETLSPGGCGIKHGELTGCSDLVTCQIGGVGNFIEESYIHDDAGRGVQLAGCNNVVSGNEFAALCTKSDDIGAIYLANRNGSQGGHRIVGNLIHDIVGKPGFRLVHAVYADDHTSNCTFEDNQISNVQTAAFYINGGRDNIISGNSVSDCAIGVFVGDRHWDAWPQEGLTSLLHNEAYNAKFPTLAAMASATAVKKRANGSKATVLSGDWAEYPIGNRVTNNSFNRVAKSIQVTGDLKASSSDTRAPTNVTSIGNSSG